MEIKLVIRWRTRDKDAVAAIRKRFGIPNYDTVNGYSPVALKSEDKELFEKTAKLGFFSILRKGWTFNGASYSW